MLETFVCDLLVILSPVCRDRKTPSVVELPMSSDPEFGLRSWPPIDDRFDRSSAGPTLQRFTDSSAVPHSTCYKTLTRRGPTLRRVRNSQSGAEAKNSMNTPHDTSCRGARVPFSFGQRPFVWQKSSTAVLHILRPALRLAPVGGD